MERIADYARLKRLSSKYKELYQASEPFPNVIIDEFFTQKQLQLLHDSFPTSNNPLWKTPSNRNTINKSVVKKGSTGIKENVLSFLSRYVMNELNSATFLSFIEDITDIKGLTGDPYLFESGYHLSRNEGYLGVHADYSHHDLTGLERRVNVLIYLNKDWVESYGGSIGLYTEDMKLQASILPIDNRVLIFNTSKTSFHGFCNSLTLDADYIQRHQGRKSIAMYYYTLPTKRERHRIIFPNDPSFVHEPTNT